MGHLKKIAPEARVMVMNNFFIQMCIYQCILMYYYFVYLLIKNYKKKKKKYSFIGICLFVSRRGQPL